MDKNYLIKLTTNLYRLTLLFPKKEPLRYKVRELADEVLADSILIKRENPNKSKVALELDKKLEILDGYFEVAKNQNWVSPYDILEIQKEYSKIKEETTKLATSETKEQEPKGQQSRALVDLNTLIVNLEKKAEKREGERENRQKRILDILKEKDRLQVGELKSVFPEVSKRTLRRDFESLLKQGLVERRGEKNETFYRLKG